VALSSLGWATLLVSAVALPGVASAVLVRSLRTEERKLRLLKDQDNIDSYSPRAMADLREWIRNNPDDSFAPEARERYNECVRTLREVDEPYYDWSEEQIADLETVEE